MDRDDFLKTLSRMAGRLGFIEGMVEALQEFPNDTIGARHISFEELSERCTELMEDIKTIGRYGL